MLGHWAVSSTLQTGVMVGVLALVTTLAGRHFAPRWTAVLWLLVFVRLVIPWNPVTLVHLSPPGVPPPMAARVSAPSPIVTTGHLTPTVVSPGPHPAPFVVAWPLLLGALWALGVVALAGRTVHREWTFRRAIRQSARLLHLGSAPQARMPAVWETAAVDAPAAFGIWRPKILVPLGLRVVLTPSEWQLMLRHELVHIQHRDVLLRWGMELVAIVYWFNPFVWVARHHVRQAQELAADDVVLAALAPGDRSQYGHTLLTVAGLIHHPTGSPSTAGMQWPRGSLAGRIGRIRQAPRHRLAGLGAATAAVLVGVAAIATGVRAAPPPTSPTALAVEHGLRWALPALRHQPGIGAARLTTAAQAGHLRVVVALALDGNNVAEVHLQTLLQHYLRDARAVSPASVQTTFLTRDALTIRVYGSPRHGPLVAWATKPPGAQTVRWVIPSHPVYPQNARGQTYGTDAPTLVLTAAQAGHVQPANLTTPTLVWVQATNGKSGFAYTQQLNGPMPKNPQQAIAMSNEPPRSIPVYAENGTTVIGQFVVGGAASAPPHVSVVVPTASMSIGPVSGHSASAFQQQVSFSALVQNMTDHAVFVIDVHVLVSAALQHRVAPGATRIPVDKPVGPHDFYRVTGHVVFDTRGMTTDQIRRVAAIQGFTVDSRP